MDIIARSARSDKTFSNIARPWVTVGYSIQPAQVGGKIPRYVHKDKHTAWETKGEQLTAESADFARRHPRDNGLLLLRNWHDRSRDLLVVDFDDLNPEDRQKVEALLPVTPLHVTSGRLSTRHAGALGGEHFYFRMEPAHRAKYLQQNCVFKRATEAKDLGDVDIKTATSRSYVVAPGSLHKSGLVYTAYWNTVAFDCAALTPDYIDALPVLPYATYLAIASIAKPAKQAKTARASAVRQTSQAGADGRVRPEIRGVLSVDAAEHVRLQASCVGGAKLRGEGPDCPLCGHTDRAREVDWFRDNLHLVCWRHSAAWYLVPTDTPSHAGRLQVTCAVDAQGHGLLPAQMRRVSLLCWGTGMGKTYAVEKEAIALQEAAFGNPVQPRILVVVPTTKLRQVCAGRMTAIKLVDAGDLGHDDIGWMEYDLSLCLQSIHRVIMDPSRPLFIVMDEVEESLKSMLGLNEKAKKRQELWTALVDLLSRPATTVRLLDAYAGPLTQQLLSACGFEAKDIGVYTAPRRIETKDQLVWSGSEAAAWATVRAQLGDGKHIAFACGSRKTASALERLAGEAYPDKTVLCVTADTVLPDSVDWHVDLLLYTSAMGSGVSIDIPDWFDCRHMQVTRQTDVTQVGQMIARVRHPKSRVVYMWGAKYRYILPSMFTYAWWYELFTKRTEEQVKTAALYGFTMGPGWAEDSATLKLAAHAQAARRHHGAGWLYMHLETNRSEQWDFMVAGVARDAKSAKDYSVAKTGAQLRRAGAIATAEPFDKDDEDDRAAERAAKSAKGKTEEGLFRLKATKLTEFYGGSYTNAGLAERCRVIQAFDDLKPESTLYSLVMLWGDAKRHRLLSIVIAAASFVELQQEGDTVACYAMLAPAVHTILAAGGISISAEATPVDRSLTLPNQARYAMLKAAKALPEQQRAALLSPDTGIEIGSRLPTVNGYEDKEDIKKLGMFTAALLGRCGLSLEDDPTHRLGQNRSIIGFEAMTALTQRIMRANAQAGRAHSANHPYVE